MEKYLELIEDKTIDEVRAALDDMAAGPETDQFRRYFCNDIIYKITAGYIQYPDKKAFKNHYLINVFLEENKKLKDKNLLLDMMANLFKDNEKSFMKSFKLLVGEMIEKLDGHLFSEGDLVDIFIEPLKNAYPGFWQMASKEISKYCLKDGTHELLNIIAVIYDRDTDDEVVDVLTDYVRKYPDIITAREYLALIYSNLKMWKNEIALLEGIDKPVIFVTNMAIYYFELGWAYDKLRNLKTAEEYYRKALEEDGFAINARNNLGYAVYRQKRYLEAKSIFEECLADDIDLPYSANNYVRTLLALGRNKDAADFIKNEKYKIDKRLVDKVNELPKTNKRLKTVDEIVEIREDSEMNTASESQLAVKGTQFSSEKLLEDELTERIEKGTPVFGMNLKMYERKGEYGRQYIIPVGRLDLLCEDDKGNLYVIELKKDSGYDDAYKQTSDYLDWFEKSDKFKDKNVYGIICLNDPTKELIDKVHADSRMKLFEYQVSYTEL